MPELCLQPVYRVVVRTSLKEVYSESNIFVNTNKTSSPKFS